LTEAASIYERYTVELSRACDFLLRKYGRAIADYEAAISLDPKNAAAYYNRGIAYQAKGDLDRAIADYGQAVVLDPKYTSAYNNLGNAYQAKGDIERAIASYDAAVRLDPAHATTYNNRGDAYQNKGDLDSAIADYNEAIHLDPGYLHAYQGRAGAYFAKGDFAPAAADDSEVIRLDAKNADAFSSRGRANLYAGASPSALADFRKASELDPKDAYAALWLEIANRRSNLPSQLAKAVPLIDMTKWPAPVIRLFLGQSTFEAALAAANDPDPDTEKGQVCEANFYGGEFELQQGKKDEAARLFRLAASNCPMTFTERDAADAELKAGSLKP